MSSGFIATRPRSCRSLFRAVAAVGACAGVLIAHSTPTVAGPKAVQVLSRAVLGNYIEDITFISSGAFSNHLAGITGFGVWGSPLNTNGNAAPQKLFDFRKTGLVTTPRGMAWIESEALLAFAQTEPDHTTLLFTDAHGNVRDRRSIQFLSSYTPSHAEGLAYISASSTEFPDHLVIVYWDSDNSGSRLELLRRDGVVVKEIIPADPDVAGDLLGAVAYKSPNLLLVGRGPEIRTLDFDGIDQAPPVLRDPSGFAEGLVELPDGRIAATGATSAIQMYDASLARLPADDKSFELGIGLANPWGVAWDPDTNEHLVNAATDNVIPVTFANRRIHALPPSLRTSRVAVDLAGDGFWRPFALAYIAAESSIVVAHRNVPPQLLLYDNNGVQTDQVSVSNPSPPPAFFNPNRVEYLPPTDQYAVRVAQDDTHVKIYSRAGAFVREFDPRPPGVPTVGSFAYFSEGTNDRLLFMMGNHTALVTDLEGNAVRSFRWDTELNLVAPFEVAAITTGLQAGAFSVVDPETGELVVFRLR